MTAGDVLKLLAALKAANIEVWIDGCWGADALLGRETRKHNDLDIVVEEKDVVRLRAFLEARGYRDLPRPDTRPCNFVLAGSAGHEIDFHVIVLDDKGNGIYGPPADNLMYPASSLTAIGAIGGQLTAVCEKYGLPVPTAYQAAKDR